MKSSAKKQRTQASGQSGKGPGISSSFIFRIVFFCVATSFFAVVVLSLVLSAYMSKIMQHEAIQESKQALVTIDEFFDQKMNATKRLLYGMYQDESIRYAVQDFFAGRNPPGEDISIIQQCSEMLNSRYGYADTALAGVSLYGLEQGKQAELLQTGAFKNRKEAIQQLLVDAQRQKEKGVTESRVFYSISLIQESADAPLSGTISVYDFIRDPKDLKKLTGLLAFHYDLDKISKQLSRFLDEKGEKIFVLSEQDTLLYSSDGDYAPAHLEDIEGFKPMKQVDVTGGKMYESAKFLMGVSENERFDVQIISLVDKRQLYRDIWTLNIFIGSVLVAALVMISIVVLLFTKRISLRIKAITDGIYKMEQGDMHTVIAAKENGDELDFIARSLTHMCNSLREKAELQQQTERQRNEAILCQKDAEIYALQAQINPHFLYNMLEVARMKAAVDGCEDTAMMVKLLANIFRGSVGRGMVATIGEELECCMLYVRLFEIRRESSIKVELDVSPEIRKCKICTHILLPIVENALVHGLSEERAILAISAQRVAEDILFTIMDNGPGIDAAQLEKLRGQIHTYSAAENHIGLANVNQRLHLMYGPQYGVSVESGKDSGFTVKLSIKSKEKAGGQDDVSCVVGG